MKQKCEQYMDRFLSLNKGEHLPFTLTMHLLSCRQCRTQVRALKKAEAAAAKPLKVAVPVTLDSITATLKENLPQYNPKKYRVPIALWIVAGTLIIAMIAVFGLFSNSVMNETLEFTTYLFFAFVITAYIILFFVANMDFFVKKVETKKAGAA